MIHLEYLPLPEAQAKAVREWLANPAFATFVGWLSNQAAKHTAEAGNLLVEGREDNELEAKRVADEARKFKAAWEIMVQFTDRSFQPDHVRLIPKPVNVSENT
jgi:hypothetical protein